MSNSIEGCEVKLKPAYEIPASSGGLLPAYPGGGIGIPPAGQNYSKPDYSTDYS